MKSPIRLLFWVAGGAFLVLALPVSAQTEKPLPAAKTGVQQNGTIDTLVFGDAATEAAHKLQAPHTAVVAGALGQKARVCLPKTPVDTYGGDLSFTMHVDPVRRNYFSIKLWGEDAFDAGRLLLYVPVKGVNYQVGYRHEGDYAPLSVSSSGAALPGRFYYSTTLLPLDMTLGKTSLTLKIVSTGRLNAAGTGTEATGGNYQYNMKARSRGIYQAYIHTEPMLIPTGEVEGDAPVAQVRPTPGEEILAPKGAFTTRVNNRIQSLLKADIEAKGFSPADVLYLAKAYSVPGLVGFHNPTIVAKVTAMIDAFAAEYAQNPEGAASAGGNESWGGRFGALGTAIELLKAPLQPGLASSVSSGTGGAAKPRRAAWADMLLASRDYGRTNRRGLTSEAIIGDLSVYGANQGLLALNDARAFPEPAAQRYLREAIGLSPWLGNDLPNGGHELRYGSNYFTVTSKGLTREWGYAGPSLGEMAAYALEMFERSGNAQFRDQAIKMLRARAPFRRPSIEKVGENYFRAMQGIGFLSWRGANETDGDGISSEMAYADRSSAASGLRVAAATLDPTLLGYAKQMLADNQFLGALLSDKTAANTLNGLQVFADYAKIKLSKGSARLPMSDGQPDFAWADEENGVLALKHGSERLWIAPFWQTKVGTGINGIARFHFSTPHYDQVGLLETVPQFRARGIFVRPADLIDQSQGFQWRPPNPPLQAYGGERLPVGVLPFDARDDAPFRGQVDFYALRFGPYLVGMNRTANRTFTLKTPVGFAGAPDLFAGARASGAVQVVPHSTVALFLDRRVDAAPIPIAPLAVSVKSSSNGATLEWNNASGAASYSVKRAPSSEGPFTTIKSGIVGTTYTDPPAAQSGTSFYTVVAVNRNGESYESMKVTTFSGAPGVNGGSQSVPIGLGGPIGGSNPIQSVPPDSAAPKEEDPILMEPFVLEGNTLDGAPPAPGPKRPSAPSS